MQIHRSENLPDQLYTGKIIVFDKTIRALYAGIPMLFPSIIETKFVDVIKRFNIDGNPIEEIELKGGVPSRLIYDSHEKQLYYLSALAKTTIDANKDPEIVAKDVLTFEENSIKFDYQDFSGLIKVSLFDAEGKSLHRRLLRIYRRDLNADDCEYVFGFIDGDNNHVDYYVGLEININQLI